MQNSSNDVIRERWRVSITPFKKYGLGLAQVHHKKMSPKKNN